MVRTQILSFLSSLNFGGNKNKPPTLSYRTQAFPETREPTFLEEMEKKTDEEIILNKGKETFYNTNKAILKSMHLKFETLNFRPFCSTVRSKRNEAQGTKPKITFPNLA